MKQTFEAWALVNKDQPYPYENLPLSFYRSKDVAKSIVKRYWPYAKTVRVTIEVHDD